MSRHCARYTVVLGGRSFGSSRQANPPRKTHRRGRSYPRSKSGKMGYEFGGSVPFADWCQEAEEDFGDHQLVVLTSMPANLTVGRDTAALLVPSHYASEERVAELLERLGKPASANFIRNKLPESKKIRSGDLGEIFATGSLHEWQL